MKVLIIILIFAISNNLNGQNVRNFPASSPNSIKIRYASALIENQPQIFIDSVKVPYEMLTQLNQENIRQISVVKNGYDSIAKTKGKIYIFLKKGKALKLYDYVTFKAKYLSTTTKPILLLKNGQFVEDYALFFIDVNSISKVEIDNGVDINPIKNIYLNHTIVNVLTKQAFNTNSVSQVILKGLPNNSEPQ